MRGIKPCPYCGSPNPSYSVEQGRDPAKGQIHCHCCGVRGPLENGIDEAAVEWNKMPRKKSGEQE